MAPVIAHVTITLRLDVLSGKPRLRQPSYAEPRYAEQAAGEVLRCGFFREEIVDTVADPVDVQSEVRYLATVLRRN